MDILSVTSEIGREVVRLTTEAEAAAALPGEPVPGHHRLGQLPAVPRDHLDVRLQARLEDAHGPQRADRAGPQGRRAGPERSRERRGRARRDAGRGASGVERDPGPRPEGRAGDRATRISPPRRRSSSDCVPARPPISRRRRSGRSRKSGPRSPTWPFGPPAASSARR